MSEEIKAVSVTRYYLDRKQFAVKAMKVFNRKDGTPYWRMGHFIAVGTTYADIFETAMQYCVKNKVAYIGGVQNGDNLTVLHKELLAMFDDIE